MADLRGKRLLVTGGTGFNQVDPLLPESCTKIGAVDNMIRGRPDNECPSAAFESQTRRRRHHGHRHARPMDRRKRPRVSSGSAALRVVRRSLASLRRLWSTRHLFAASPKRRTSLADGCAFCGRNHKWESVDGRWRARLVDRQVLSNARSGRGMLA